MFEFEVRLGIGALFRLFQYTAGKASSRLIIVEIKTVLADATYKREENHYGRWFQFQRIFLVQFEIDFIR